MQRSPPRGPFRDLYDLQPYGNYAHVHEEDDIISNIEEILCRYQNEYRYLLSVVDKVPLAVAISTRRHLQCITFSIENYKNALQQHLELSYL